MFLLIVFITLHILHRTVLITMFLSSVGIWSYLLGGVQFGVNTLPWCSKSGNAGNPMQQSEIEKTYPMSCKNVNWPFIIFFFNVHCISLTIARFKVVECCWSIDSHRRPSFAELVSRLQHVITFFKE